VELYETTAFHSNRVQRIRRQLGSQSAIRDMAVSHEKLADAAERYDHRFYDDLKSAAAPPSHYATFSDCSSAARALARYAESAAETADPFSGAEHLIIYKMQDLDCRASLGLLSEPKAPTSTDQILPVLLRSYQDGAVMLTKLLDPKTLPAAMANSQSRNALNWAIVFEVLFPAKKLSWDLAYAARTSNDDNDPYQHSPCFAVTGPFEKLVGSIADQIRKAEYPKTEPEDINGFVEAMERCNASLETATKNAL
jgi:hypothetical protein